MNKRTFLFILKLSRPRFWLYLVGIYWVGTIIGISSINQATNPWLWILLIYFLFPANIYLYGINDYFDRDTDAFNAKKEGKEVRIKNQDTHLLQQILVITSLLTFLIILFVPSVSIKILLLLFYLLSTFYSAPPLRFKAKPFVDFTSNLLYAIPGIIGFTLLSNSFPSLPVLLALFCWTSAMHLFSAIPDIAADTKAKITTTAVLLGTHRSLMLCFFFWLVTALIPIIYGYALPLTLLLLIYPGLIIIVWVKQLNLTKVYWWFPYITGTLGFIGYWYFFILKLLL